MGETILAVSLSLSHTYTMLDHHTLLLLKFRKETFSTKDKIIIAFVRNIS